MEQQIISSDLIRGHIDTIILHTLLDGDKFPQQISDSVEEKSDKEYKINQATLYSSLKRLESLKYVRSYWNDSESGRRKFYNLTEIGKNTVEANLSNWSFSRAIIDKLMDCAPQPIYKTQYVEKIVEVVKEVPKVIPEENLKEPVVEEKSEEKIEKPINSDNLVENTQEINFRNILNGLIKSTTVQNKPVQETLEPLEKDQPEEKDETIQKFNDKISSTDYNAVRNNNGKIDFGDLSLKAAKEGYKLRISSKDSFVKVGNLLINKLNLASAITIFLLSIVSLYVVCFGIAKNASWSTSVALIGTILFLVFPVVYLFAYLKSPKLTTAKRVTADGILSSSIVVFNLVLITIAANLIFNVDFSEINTIMISLVLPLIVYVLITIYFVIKLMLSKLDAFKVKI